MSFFRKAFIVWWTALVLFIATFMYVNRDLMPPVTYDSTFSAGLAAMISALRSGLPDAFFRLLPP